MMDDSKIKKMVIALLIVAIFIMSSAYAILYRNLTINGNASVIASWKVQITGIKEANKVGNAISTTVPTYTISTATFNAQLNSVSDSIEYIVTIDNDGKIDAKLNSITVAQSGDKSIVYEVTGVKENDILKAGSSVDVTIKVSANSATGISDSMNSSVTIAFNYIQNI